MFGRVKILVTCLVLAGCSNPVMELKGKVQDDFTMSTVPHRKIIVSEITYNSRNQLIPVYLDQFYTNDSGYFNYNLRRSKYAYMFNFSVVGDSDYAYANYRLGLSDLKRNGKFLSFQTSKLTDLTIALERSSYNSFTDTLYVSWESNGINGKKLYPYKIKSYGKTANPSDIEFRWIGGAVQSTIKTKVYADKKTIIYWDLYRLGEIRKITDTIICRRDVNNYTNFNY